LNLRNLLLNPYSGFLVFAALLMCLPLVVTMHGRAINLRHPALKKSPEERSRIVVWNNWMSEKKKPLQNVIVIAPTGRPEGFSFEKAPDFAGLRMQRSEMCARPDNAHIAEHTISSLEEGDIGTTLESYQCLLMRNGRMGAAQPYLSHLWRVRFSSVGKSLLGAI